MTAKRDMQVYLADILESIELIERYVRGSEKETFHTDAQL